MTDTDPTAPTPSDASENGNTSSGKAHVTSPASSNIVKLPNVAAQQTPSEKVVAFVKEHPKAAIAGGLIAGVAISALIPRLVRGRKSKGDAIEATGTKLLERAIHLAEAAGTAGVVLGKEASSRAHDAGTGVRQHATDLAEHAEKLGAKAASRLEKYGELAVSAANAIAQATARQASRLSDSASETAHQIGEVAHEQSEKAASFAEKLKSRAK